MSHFNVAVFSYEPGHVDDLLAPYCEDVGPHSEYAEFVPHEDADYDESMKQNGYWHNPNARWDWYCVGGRWRGHLKLKDGCSGEYGPLSRYDNKDECVPGRCDIALTADCDFSPNESAYHKAIRFWEVIVEGQPLKEGEPEFFNIYKPEYFIERYGTKEAYAKDQSNFTTYAFVSAGGEWHETGHMGWWGIDDATKESRESYRNEMESYLREAVEKGLYITIVDCHI